MMNKLYASLRNGFFAACTLGFVALTSPVQAVTLNVVGGQLLGASGVNVGGNLFNVEFLDGTCVALFDGCDEITDFPFNDFASASLAAQALLDSVLVNGPQGQFDTNPALTNGLSNTLAVFILIPYENTTDSLSVRTATIINAAIETTDGIGFSQLPITFDLSDTTKETYARFTAAPVSAVPLPAALPLFGTGLALMGFIGWRRKRKLNLAA